MDQPVRRGDALLLNADDAMDVVDGGDMLDSIGSKSQKNTMILTMQESQLLSSFS